MNWSFLVFLILVGVVGIIAYLRGTDYGRYSQNQHETDIRLTYKRYKELYPHSTISYEDYKELQKKHAFTHSVNSRNLKRMVR